MASNLNKIMAILGRKISLCDYFASVNCLSFHGDLNEGGKID